MAPPSPAGSADTAADLAAVRRAQAGDRDALRELAQRWWPDLRRWAFVEIPDPIAAEDAVQDAMVRIVRSIGSFDPRKGSLRTWLRTIVRNAARDVRDRRRRAEGREVGGVGEVVQVAEMDRGRLPDLDQRIDLSRTRERVMAAFEALAPRMRELVDLVDVQGMTPTEAAQALGLTPGAVRAQLHAGRRALRGRLIDEDDEIRLLLRSS